jgi:two-component system OmpR family response regulator
MRVLIGDDDEAAATVIANGLGLLGHKTVWLRDGRSIAERLLEEDFDVVILDRVLPGWDGLSVLTKARARGLTTPILFLTALDSVRDRVEGLEAGADDYIVKPVAIEELSARIGAILRRNALNADAIALKNGKLSMSLLHRDVHFNGRRVRLLPLETGILEQLLRNPGRPQSRSMLLQAVWGYHFDPQTSIVETHMCRLRAKLARAGAGAIIETVRGAGYRLRRGKSRDQRSALSFGTA